MPNKKFVTVWLFWLSISAFMYSQNLEFAKQQVRILSSPEFHGRGYVKEGDAMASRYLASEFALFHLKKFGNDYYQPYQFTVNTFPGRMEVKINGEKLVPATDYLIYPPSSSINGIYDIQFFDSTLFTPGFSAYNLFHQDFTGKFVVIDTIGWGKDTNRKNTFDLFSLNSVRAAGIIILTDHELTHSVSQYQLKYCLLIVKRNALKSFPKRIELHIESQFVNHSTTNVIGYVPGRIDSFLVVTAHFDHLGMMGDSVYFPGANDNASGTSMVLDLARDLAAGDKPKYSYAFMLFSGEEAGLVGSSYYTRHPLFPLEKIKRLINIDMVGTGSDGVDVFNGNSFPKEFHMLDSINKTDGLHLKLHQKGISKASDHYLFQELKVRTLYFATLGKETGYHSPGDTFEKLPFTAYESLYKLIHTYLKTI
jgi:aminopeptidase YwaD